MLAWNDYNKSRKKKEIYIKILVKKKEPKN